MYGHGFLRGDSFCPSLSYQNDFPTRCSWQCTVTLILEIISLDIFPFVGSGMIPVLHISRGIFSPVDYVDYVRTFQVQLFCCILGILTILLPFPIVRIGLYSKWLWVTWKISQHWKEKWWLLKINSCMGAQVFQPCCLVRSSIVSTQLLVLLCSWRHLSTQNLPKVKITNIVDIAHF